MGKRMCAVLSVNLTYTQIMADRLVRLPLWVGLEDLQDRIIKKVIEYFEVADSARMDIL